MFLENVVDVNLKKVIWYKLIRSLIDNFKKMVHDLLKNSIG